MHLNRESRKRWEWANGQKNYVYEENLAAGGCLPELRGYIHVYHIQTFSSL